MPHPSELSRTFDPITADWTYIRWLGDRKGIERITTTWDKPIIESSYAKAFPAESLTASRNDLQQASTTLTRTSST
jgi:hypothetical protein